MDVIAQFFLTETDGPHPRPECSPTRCPMCNFADLVDENGDVAKTLQCSITRQKRIEESHDLIHNVVQQLYGLRWSLKSHPQPADAIFTFTVKDPNNEPNDFRIRAENVLTMEWIVRSALRKRLRDHRELEIRRRELERVLIGRAEKPQWLLDLTDSKALGSRAKEKRAKDSPADAQ